MNIRSLRGKTKRLAFEAILEHLNFDVITVTETWWTEELTQSLLQFDKYIVASRSDREVTNPKYRGGGVAILIKKGIKFHSPTSINISNYAQIATVKIKDLQLITLYRKPNDNWQMDQRVADFVTSKFKADNLVLTGDFNIPKADWRRNKFLQRTAKLWSMVRDEMHLVQHIQDPTHEKGNILDLLFSRSTSNDIVGSTEIDEIIFHDLTDHYSIFADIKIVIVKEVIKKEVYDVKRMDWDHYKEVTKEMKIVPKVYRQEEVGEKWQSIIGTLIFARNDACPKITVMEGNSPKWINKQLHAQLKKAQRLRKLSKLEAAPSVVKKRIQKAKFHQKRIKNMALKSRAEYEMKQIMLDRKNPKTLFQNMKKARNIMGNIPPLNDPSGNPLKTDADKANALQDKFLSVFTPMDSAKVEWPENWGLNHIVFSPSRVKWAIKSMNTNASPGADGIGPIYYKNCDLSIVFALCDLYQTSFDNTIMPEAFLIGKVIPLWKNKGSISDLKNYRGITLGCTGFKPQEMIILATIDEHLESHNLLDPWQHGFMRQRSTITNLMSTWDFISKEIDNGNSWVTLSLDFSSAFDTISIHHLLLSLKKRGIGGRLGMFIEYWLKNRQQYVEIAGQKSRTEKCTSGISQGSNSGPRFFSILLSDVFGHFQERFERLNVRLYCFADDSRIIFKSRNLLEALKIQALLDDLNLKIKEVGLKLNASKSVMVYYGLEKFRHIFSIDGVEIPVMEESVELGCILSNSMNFNSQLQRNTKKALTLIFMIRNTFKVRNYLMLKRLYYTYYVPTLLFSCQIWMTPLKGTKDLLYRMYRRFWYLGEGKITPKEEVLDPYQLATKHCLTFLFQMTRNETCLNPEEYFQYKTRTVTRSENKNDMIIQRSKHVYRSNFFTINFAKEYNKLPLDIRNSCSTNVFKAKIKDHIVKTDPTPEYSYVPYHMRNWRF